MSTAGLVVAALLLLAAVFVIGFVIGAFVVAAELRSEPTESADVPDVPDGNPNIGRKRNART